MQKLALLSVSDKTGLFDFAKVLVEKHGYRLLSTGGSGWNGFDYVVNRTVTGDTAAVERLGADGEAQGSAGTARIAVQGRYLAVSVPRAAVGLDKDKFSFSFKVADHVLGYTDIMNYYIQGDCAPIGRFGYTVSG